MSRISKIDRYLPMSGIYELRALPPIVARRVKPDMRCDLVMVEGGCTVIRLFDGFPVDRSSYGRITLAHVARRAPASARACEDQH